MTGCTNRRYGHNCGQCAYCRALKAKEWSLRITMSQSRAVHAVFLTLTYSDEHLPPDGRLVKTDLQKFFKRLRRSISYHKGEDYNFKYFCCGEYGDIFHRPHYHVILWSDNINFAGDDKKYIENAWQFGFIKIGTVTEGSINYVTGYVLKKQAKHKKWYYFGNTEYTFYINWFGATDYFIPYGITGDYEFIPPFNTQSLGIGKEWFLEHFDTCLKDGGIYYKGHLCPIPRYFVRKYIYTNNQKHIDYNQTIAFIQMNILLKDLQECLRQKITPFELKAIRQRNKISKIDTFADRRFDGGKLDIV